MISFDVLASSSEGCCYLVRSGDAPPLLLDAGVPFLSVLRALGSEIIKLGACLITHAHGDHVRCAKRLLESAVPIYASREALDAAHLNSYYARPLKTTATGYEPFTVGGWQIQPFGVVHDAPGTVGYFIGEPNGDDKLLYLTDSAYSPYTFAGLTHIAIECNHDRDKLFGNARDGDIDLGRARRTVKTHMSIQTVLDFLKANELSKLKEVHLLHLSDENSDEDDFKRRVQEVAGCPVYVAQKRAA